MSDVYVGDSEIHGRGVFAMNAHLPGDMLGREPVLLVPRDELPDALSHHVYEWDRQSVALCMGTGSFYNHDDEPSVEWELDYYEHSITFRALRSVAAGEELTIDYGESHDWS